MPIKISTENFINNSKIKHGDVYDYSKVVYKSNLTKVIIVCKKHGDFEQRPSGHLQGNGCRECSIINRTLTIDEFINKSKIKHGNLYDYSKVDYKSNRNKVIIVCKNHGDFEQIPSDHLKGSGCEKCAHKILTTIDFINRSKLKHGDLYDYSKVIYKKINNKVIITCSKHGDFQQIPNNHLKGRGCEKCSHNKTTLTTEEFVKKSKIKHGELYDYFKVDYKNANSKIIITCKIHGDFKQKPANHISCGAGCPKCAFRYSKVAIDWLNYIQYTINKEIQNMLSPSGEYTIPTTLYKADGYCEQTNTVYEFHGDFWHGNPKIYFQTDINPVSKKTYGELYKQTQERKNQIIKLGYNYVEMWEYDWDKAIKAIIKIQKIWKKYLKKFQKINDPRVLGDQ